MKPFNVITLHYFPKKGLKSAGKKTAPPIKICKIVLTFLVSIAIIIIIITNRKI